MLRTQKKETESTNKIHATKMRAVGRVCVYTIIFALLTLAGKVLVGIKTKLIYKDLDQFSLGVKR